MIYQSRKIEMKLLQMASDFPAIWITGPRQSGKTTLAKNIFKDYRYISMEDLDNRNFGNENPRGFLRIYDKYVILDEVQRCPGLLSYLQTHIDEHQIKGQFILTGSIQYHLSEAISQSLAGRAGILYLLPFSLAESFDLEGTDIESFEIKNESRLPVQQQMEEILFNGFYPAIISQKVNTQNWYSSYYATYIERDVKLITNIHNISQFDVFVRICASRSGCLLNLSEISTTSGLSVSTVKNWLSVLEACGIIFLLRPLYKNLNKRLVKTPKLYFYDTGLLCYLLRINDPEILKFHPLKGQIFETLMVSEIIKQYFNQGMEAPVYFWRDNKGLEVDVIIDKGHYLMPVEIKISETFNKDFLNPT